MPGSSIRYQDTPGSGKANREALLEEGRRRVEQRRRKTKAKHCVQKAVVLWAAVVLALVLVSGAMAMIRPNPGHVIERPRNGLLAT